VIEQDLGLLSRAVEESLNAHLRGCADCRALVGFDALVIHDLASLRNVAPVEVEVEICDRVRAEVRALPTLERTEVPGRQLGWSAAALALGVGALGLSLLAWLRGGSFPLAGLQTLGHTVLALLTSLGHALKAVGGVALELAAALIESLTALTGTATLLRPAMWAALAVGYLLMGLIITTVLGRDLARRRPLPQVVPGPRAPSRRDEP
jgi:hypothetical protein